MDSIIPVDVRIPLFEKVSLSPSKKYRFLLEQSRVKFTNIIITRAIVTTYSEPTEPGATGPASRPEVITEIDIQQDPHGFWHCWVQGIDKTEYLLTKGIKNGALLISMASRTSSELQTDFTWRFACVSPNNDKLAVACSKESKNPIRVYDFRNILNPPYVELTTTRFPDIEKSRPYQCGIKWRDNISLEVTVPVHTKDKLAFGFAYCTQDFILEVNPFESLASVREEKRDIRDMRNRDRRYSTSTSTSDEYSWSDESYHHDRGHHTRDRR